MMELIPSPSSRCAGGLVELKLMTGVVPCAVYTHPKDGERVGSLNVGKPSNLDAVVCRRIFH